MAEFCPQIILPQVRMGIKMNDMQLRILFLYGPESS